MSKNKGPEDPSAEADQPVENPPIVLASDPTPPMPAPSRAIQWEAVLTREFARETDRAVVIVAVALLDAALLSLLKARLSPNPAGQDELLDGRYAPLSTFSARIDLAFRMGLLSGRFARDLHLIRRIRNDFAHNISGCSFEDSVVRDRVQELSRGLNWGRKPENRAYFPPGPRGDFQMCASWVQWYLHSVADVVEAIPPMEEEWGYRKPK